MALEQKHRRDIRAAIARLDEHDLLFTPVREGGKGPFALKAHPLAPEEVDGVRPAAIDHSPYNYLHEGPEDNCPMCRSTVLRKETRELLQGLLT